MKNVIRYCTKEENYISNFDVSDRVKKGASHKKVIAEGLITKKVTLTEAVKEHPEMLFELDKLHKNLNLYWKLVKDDRETLPDWIPNPWNQLLSSKIPNKRRHYWIFSRKPNLGKTFMFAKPLSEKYRCLLQSGDFTYWNISGQEECIILDEYNHAFQKYYILNCMCDGTYGYRVFMGGIQRLNNPLIIILSNQSINDLYPFMNELLHERFNEIELK